MEKRNMNIFKVSKNLMTFMILAIATVFIATYSIAPAFAQKHKIANYKAETWDTIMKELHAHVEELVDFANEGNLKEIEAIIPEVIEHAQEMVAASQKDHNADGAKYAKKIEETAPEILNAAQAGDQGKIKVRLNDINKYTHKIMASNPGWIIDEMHVHIREMRSALKEGNMNELEDIAMETYGHMTDLAASLKKEGKTAASEASKESRKYMKEVKKGKNISSNISGFENSLNKIASQI